MTTLNDLYDYYCRRSGCIPNSMFTTFLQEEYARQQCTNVLHDIDVSNNYLGKKGIIPVLDLVKNVKTVVSLDVSNNLLEHEQLDHLVYCLALHPSIARVALRDNCLHDGSICHILELLDVNHSITQLELDGNDFLASSLALVEERLYRNRDIQAKLAAEADALDAIRAANRRSKEPQTKVSGELPKENSGGYLHFASWWQNPQYRITISRTSTVRIGMDIADGIEARQGGFVVLRFDGIRRVISIDKRTVVAESNVDSVQCTLDVSLGETSHYVVMPFTFHPGRSMRYTLSASLVPDAPTLDPGWVRLDQLDARYDWYTIPLDGEWTGANAGGSPALHTWRLNDMYRICYQHSDCFPESSQGTVCLLMYKDADSDHNDEKEIGLDVVEHDAYGKEKPPMVVSGAKQFRVRAAHERTTCHFLKLSVRVSNLDFFVVPSTKAAGQLGSYRLVVFSTLPVEVGTSHFPHGWYYRTLRGTWDEHCCGGSREAYLSWKSNPAVAVLMDGAKPMTACVEVVGASGALVAVDAADKSAEAEKEMTEEEDEEMDPKELRALSEQQAFLRRHKAGAMEVCLTAVDAQPPKYATRRTSKFSYVESSMTLVDTSGEFYLVPTTRHAGQLGEYQLHLFCEDHFVIAGVDTLSLRERQHQLDTYAEENRTRTTAAADDADASLGAAADASPDMLELAITRDTILSKCLSTGVPFSDRDFPRGPSSLFLAPDAKPPLSFPKEYAWRRVMEIVCEQPVQCLDVPKADEDAGYPVISPPFPYGKRQWFASIVHALSAKPSWLRRIFLGYDREAGFAQFRFWVSDRWVGVTVDDYLPVDNACALCMGHAVGPTDFFFPLIEKAYAKLHRCYEALEPKVVPELTLLDVFARGMMDVSGAFCTVHTIRGAEGVELTPLQKDALWRKMKEATKRTTLLSLVLRNLPNVASERKPTGILPDHLYGIMDARFVEQQRLVKLRNWSDSADSTWKGRWAPHSSNWTDTLLSVLNYDHSQDVIWMSFDEVVYYFTDMLATEEPQYASRITGDFSVPRLDCADAEDTLPHPQFALEVWDLPIEDDPVEVIIGLHQRDARKSITRDKHAVAKYRNAIGFAVIATDDNQRRLLTVKDEEVVGLVKPARSRDLYCSAFFNPRNISRERLTVMPIKEHDADPNVQYYITARSPAGVQLALSPVSHVTTERQSGVWRGVTAGGPPSCATWRNNQQFFLFPSEAMEVSVFLVSHSPHADKSIGFTMHTTRRCSSFLHFDPSSVVLDVPAEAKHSVGASVTLQGMQGRRGMPYVIVPYCTSTEDVGEFTVEVVGNRKLTFTPIEPRLDWHRVVRTLSLRCADGSTGGCPRFPSWRCNPQLVMDFPVEREGRVLISAANCNRKDERNEIGMMLLRADMKYERGCRRKLMYSPEEVVAVTEDAVGRAELDIDLNMVGNDEPLILVVYTTMPYKEVDIEVSFYSAPALQVAPVSEWKCVALEESSWELGQTAGGSRTEFASWINNPFIGLSAIRRTNVVLLLIQYPRGPEKPIAKRFGNKKMLLPPPITNPESRMSIELDLVKYDDALTPIMSVGPTRNAEVLLETVLEPCEERPYLLVPCTTIPEKNGDFKLFVYADQPVDVYNVEKPRLHYV